MMSCLDFNSGHRVSLCYGYSDVWCEMGLCPLTKCWPSFNQVDAQPREIPQMHHCNSIPSDLLQSQSLQRNWCSWKKNCPWAPGVIGQCDRETCCGHCQLLPSVHGERSLLGEASGVFLNQKQDRVLSQQPVADSRHQTAFREKRNPCCQKVCRVIAQICTRGFLLSNAIASFQQNWRSSKRFPSSQTGFATSPNQPQFLPSFLDTCFCLFLSIYFKQYSRWGQLKENENHQSRCQVKPEHVSTWINLLSPKSFATK